MKIIGEHGACVFWYVYVMHSLYSCIKQNNVFDTKQKNLAWIIFTAIADYYKLLGTKYLY